MAEYDTSWHHCKGPRIDSHESREKLYNLLCLFLASSDISELCEGEIGCAFTALRDEHEESQITQLLIECAVLIRLKDDLFEQFHGFPSGAEKDIVGLLWVSSGNPIGQPLNLREACNKLIHSKLINFDINRVEEWHRRYLKPTVYMQGSAMAHPGKQNWTLFGLSSLVPRCSRSLVAQSTPKLA
ncbi:MAG: hypothetical protein IPJ98_22875 [Bryobacterales bacterium]|nr:hypothetical protein [Bryobacterales bacterium]